LGFVGADFCLCFSFAGNFIGGGSAPHFTGLKGLAKTTTPFFALSLPYLFPT